MDWLRILGAIGGSAGILALIKGGIDLFNAKSNRTKIDIQNMQEMLNESHRMFNEVSAKYDSLEKKMEEDRVKTREYIDSLRAKIEKRDEVIDTLVNKVHRLERSITRAYGCRFPEDVYDCPVIQEHEKKHLCVDCEHNKEAKQ